jgi:hypothetical protein
MNTITESDLKKKIVWVYKSDLQLLKKEKNIRNNHKGVPSHSITTILHEIIIDYFDQTSVNKNIK